MLDRFAVLPIIETFYSLVSLGTVVQVISSKNTKSGHTITSSEKLYPCIAVPKTVLLK